MLVHHEGKDDLMGAQEGDERQCGLGKSGVVGGGAEQMLSIIADLAQGSSSPC